MGERFANVAGDHANVPLEIANFVEPSPTRNETDAMSAPASN